MTTTVASPLTLDEIRDIHVALLAAQAEIHNPGAARSRGQRDLMADIEDALYRLADVIERTERLVGDVDSDGYPLSAPRQWSEDELAELRRRERACDNYGSD